MRVPLSVLGFTCCTGLSVLCVLTETACGRDPVVSGLPPRCPAQDPPAGLPLEGSMAAQRGLSLGKSRLWALGSAGSRGAAPHWPRQTVLEGVHKASLCVSPGLVRIPGPAWLLLSLALGLGHLTSHLVMSSWKPGKSAWPADQCQRRGWMGTWNRTVQRT